MLALVAAIAATPVPAGADDHGAPWDGTPISQGLGPTYGEEWCASTAGESVDALQGPPLALMPYSALRCSLEQFESEAAAAGVPQRMSYEVIGQSTVGGRDIYEVVIDARETGHQTRDSQRTQQIRKLALDKPAQAQRLLENWGGATKIPVWVQANIHGGEREGYDAVMQIVRDLVTTPYGENPDVDAVLDNVVLILVPTLNPDGRVAGTRQNGNNFDMNRDFFTQSQDEVKASVASMAKWLPTVTLDLHGYYNPTLVDGQTFPHNPGIEYDLYQPWNYARVLENRDALLNAGYGVQVPVFDYGDSPATAEGWDDWGPFYTPVYGQLTGAMDSSTIEICSNAACGGRFGSKTVAYISVWATLQHALENRQGMLHDQMEVYRRGVEGEERRTCCPEPYGPNHDWMTDFPYPTAHVIPIDGSQRSNPEANRLVEFLLFNDLEVTELTRPYTWNGQRFEAGSYVVWMNQAKRGLANTTLTIGADVSDKVTRLYAPPAAWSHGHLWGASVIEIPGDDTSFAPRTKPVSDTHALAGGVRGEGGDWFALAVDSPTAVRAVNDLVRNGLTAELAVEPFETSGGSTLPAGSIIFPADAAVEQAITARGESDGLWFEGVAGPKPAVESVDGVPRIAVLASSANQAVWALRNLGFETDAVSTGGSSPLNDAGAENPLDDYDVVYNGSSWPSGATARSRLTDFFDGGGGYIGVGTNGANFIGSSGANQFSGVTASSAGGGGQSGIVRWENVGGAASPVTGAYPAEDTAITDPITWFTGLPETAEVAGQFTTTDYFAAGLWRPENRTAPTSAPLILHGESTAEGSSARITTFAFDPLYRADPEREWPMLASAAYWADR